MVVGLLLAGLFCIQCTRTDAFRRSRWVSFVSARPVGVAPSETLTKLEDLAKSDHIALLEHCLDNYRENFSTYTTTLVKHERINGRVGKEQTIDVKFMASPFSVAMKWTANPGAADRIIFVEGKNGSKMIARPANLLLRALAPSVLRDPSGKDAKAASLRTVDQFGFERGMMSLLDVYRRARQAGDLKEAFGGYAQVAGRKAIVLFRYLPPKNDYPAYRTAIFIDLEYMVPVCIEGYDWQKQAELICRYVYKDVKFNVHLTDEDFLPQANDIKARK